MIRVTLKEVLKARRMSQRELARRIGKHPETVSKFARQATGGVMYDLLNRICGVLECGTGDLLCYVHDAPEQTTLFEDSAPTAPENGENSTEP